MANKKLTNIEIAAIQNELLATKSSIRKNAAKKIRKYDISELGQNLFEAYLKEKSDKRTWETQMEMLQALGKIGYKKALQEIKSIIEKNEKLDMITFVSALSYVRLSKTTDNDITPILELLNYGDLSVLSGAMAALTFDNMIPSNTEIQAIIQTIENINDERLSVTGVPDPRSYLISAMSQWNLELSKDFLQKYANNKSLKTNVEAALSGKKSRLE